MQEPEVGHAVVHRSGTLEGLHLSGASPSVYVCPTEDSVCSPLVDELGVIRGPQELVCDARGEVVHEGFVGDQLVGEFDGHGGGL